MLKALKMRQIGPGGDAKAATVLCGAAWKASPSGAGTAGGNRPELRWRTHTIQNKFLALYGDPDPEGFKKKLVAVVLILDYFRLSRASDGAVPGADRLPGPGQPPRRQSKVAAA